MLLAHVGFFLENKVSCFQKCFDIWKGVRISKKIFHNCAKRITFLRRFDRRNMFFLDIGEPNSKKLFSNDSKCKTAYKR